MNNFKGTSNGDVTGYQLDKFQELIAKLFQCCQERMQYQCERFELPDAEFRCLGLFVNERYLTAKSIAHKMNVVKSRVSKIIDGLIKKNLIQRVRDPEDSRIQLPRVIDLERRKPTYRSRNPNQTLPRLADRQL